MGNTLNTERLESRVDAAARFDSDVGTFDGSAVTTNWFTFALIDSAAEAKRLDLTVNSPARNHAFMTDCRPGGLASPGRHMEQHSM